jgi:hypothetical protein
MIGRAVALLLVLVAGACGPGEQVDSVTTSTVMTTSTTTEPTVPDRFTTTALSDTTTTTTVVSALIEIVDGEVEGPDVIEVDLGSTVDVWVLSDIDDEAHVHGYDLIFEVSGGTPFHLTFVADVPGIFEVEVHTGHTHLFDLRVLG